MSQYNHNFKGQDSHLDPPDEPDVQNDDEYLSTCCTANRMDYESDICSRCQEHATFENDKGEVEDETIENSGRHT